MRYCVSMDTTINLTAAKGCVRLDLLISEELPEISRSSAQKLIENGLVTLNGKTVKKNHKVSEGEVFSITLPPPQPADIQPQNIPLDIIYEDSDVIVINKPRGMVVHPAPGHPDGTLVNALLYHCGHSLSGIGGVIRPGIVHRIDMDTSGLLVAAKNDAAHLFLSAQLSDRSLSREYEAVACGRFRDDSGTVDAPIGRHPTDRKRMCVTDKNSRPAVTHYEVIARYNGYTHIRCKLETGRTHQIRVHMASIGHPLLGDLVYGHKKPEKGLSGQCLHARRIKFIHPTTHEYMSFEAPLPEYFLLVLERLGNPTA
jgi:23S rRNA pseudouridine1911/1915/1917 synthase